MTESRHGRDFLFCPPVVPNFSRSQAGRGDRPVHDHNRTNNMKTTKNNFLRRALTGLITGLALGGMFAPAARASIYQMASNYPAGTPPPFNAGGGIPAQAFLTLSATTST